MICATYITDARIDRHVKISIFKITFQNTPTDKTRAIHGGRCAGRDKSVGNISAQFLLQMLDRKLFDLENESQNARHHQWRRSTANL